MSRDHILIALCVGTGIILMAHLLALILGVIIHL